MKKAKSDNKNLKHSKILCLGCLSEDTVHKRKRKKWLLVKRKGNAPFSLPNTT